MSYELAPATALVATRCACCSRPLVDAVSVETGVGPICREKYGYNESQGEADWKTVESILLHWPASEALSKAIANRDAHKAANVLVHAVASLRACSESHAYIAAIAALGYEKLASACAEANGVAEVCVYADAARKVYRVSAPYNAVFTAAVRKIPGRYFVRDEKVDVIPQREKSALWKAIQQAYPKGTIVRGSKVVIL